MIKTHPKSKIYRMKSINLEDFKGVILQVEHILEPVATDRYHCYVEAVSKEDYKNETNQNLIELKEYVSGLLNTSMAFREHYKEEITLNKDRVSKEELSGYITKYNEFTGRVDAFLEVLRKIDLDSFK